MIKRIAAIILCALLSLLASGCGSTQDAYIYFELPEAPTILDPQIASTDSELIIIKNIFEGLLRKDADGNIACGAAASYDLDGLTYTFKIRDDAKWSSGEDLTAYDYEFAFKRAVSPETKAPFVSRLFSVKGAKQIYNGKAKVDTLGVKAVADKTLTITLSKADSEFEDTLTTSVAMPCNKEFFTESGGKYGLSAENILSNGSYKLTRWRKDSFGIRLYKNGDYAGNIPANNAAVFLTCDDEESALVKLKKNSVDMAFIESAQKTQAESAGLKLKEFENICWVLTVGNEFPQDVRKSLMMLVGSEVYSDDMPEGCSPATSIFPGILNSSESKLSGMPAYDPSAAKTLYFKEAENFENSKFPPDALLYYYDDGYSKNVITDIVGHWQSNLSAFVNIESVTKPELLIEQLTNPDYSMSFFPIKAESGRKAEYLKNFGIDYNNESLNSIQTKLLKSNNIMPVMFQNTTIAYSDALNKLSFEYGNGYVDFAFIIKKE